MVQLSNKAILTALAPDSEWKLEIRKEDLLSVLHPRQMIFIQNEILGQMLERQNKSTKEVRVSAIQSCVREIQAMSAVGDAQDVEQIRVNEDDSDCDWSIGTVESSGSWIMLVRTNKNV
jgi:hypothetical protein